MSDNGQIAVNISTAGDNTVVTAANSRQVIYVNAFTLSFVGNMPSTIQFKSGTTALSGPTTALDWVQDPREGSPIYITNPGDSLIIALGDAIVLGGTLWITRAP